MDSCGVLEVLSLCELGLQLVQSPRTFHLRPLPIELHQSSLAKNEGMLSFVVLLCNPGTHPEPSHWPQCPPPHKSSVLMNSLAYRIISTRLGSYRNTPHTCTYMDTKSDNQCKMLSDI